MIDALAAGLLLLDASVGPAAVSVQPAPGCPIVIEGGAKTTYSHLPTAHDLAAVYPAFARSKGISSKIVLNCTILSDGRLGDCVVVSDEHPELGFDGAGLEVVKKVRLAHDALPDFSRCPPDQPPKFVVKFRFSTDL